MGAGLGRWGRQNPQMMGTRLILLLDRVGWGGVGCLVGCCHRITVISAKYFLLSMLICLYGHLIVAYSLRP